MEKDFAALRRFIRPRTAVERCDLCALELIPGHPHLIEPGNRQIVCACDACAFLFSSQEGRRFKRIPRDAFYLNDFHLSDVQWGALMLPIQLAFFVHSTPDERLVALYPSPAGATESTLPLDSWDEIVNDNPVMRDLQPDVEALLVNRVGEKREYFIAPIDKCYELVGLIRAKWTGLSGGTEAWKAIDGFFSSLKENARPARKEVARA
jgi:hypothetical protein